MTIMTLGIDLAKRVFQLYGVDSKGKAILKKRASRSQLLSIVANFPSCLIGGMLLKILVYDFHELDEIILAYAMTIHKSRGSEYPVIIIPLMTQHYPMLQKNLVYTGITRGKKLVILVGQKKALAIAVGNKKMQKRWSMLESRLKVTP